MTNIRSQKLIHDFCRIRNKTKELTLPLTVEDMQLQSMPDASPSKWHLAHTTWFFEQFILLAWKANYQAFNPDFNYLFNSYYEAVGPRHQRPLRGLLSRPPLTDIWRYRDHIDEQILALLDRSEELPQACLDGIELGLHHEMQHQELLLTDILHALSFHPFAPALHTLPDQPKAGPKSALEYHQYEGGLINIGTNQSAFSYDCERPEHPYYLQPFAMTNRLISNGEWLEFIEDKGYEKATLWLSDGWMTCQQQHWQAPLYWQKQDGQWLKFGFHGLVPVDLQAPVSHISYFEADAFATWAGARLPREQEWETVAKELPIQGNFLEQQHWRPQATESAEKPSQLYGDVWEWTQSPFTPYPGFKTAAGAVGEYNGKFMCGQFVLKGGSCVTPCQQIRPSYRNFFYPHQRWQFSGLRLAQDI